MQPLVKPFSTLDKNHYPVKILQFGSGNFLLGFVDWMVQVANEKTGFNAGISVIQEAPGIRGHERVYTVVLKGLRNEEYISKQYKIDIIQRVIDPAEDFVSFLNEALNPDLQFIISNTSSSLPVFTKQDATVSAIASTFPGRLTQLLYKRYRSRLDNSLVILPTESGEQNGVTLKANVQKYCQHWDLPSEFVNWLNVRTTFCNSLVDRVVSGFPRKSEVSANNKLVVEGEWFHQWVIEGPRWMEEVLPLNKAGLNVTYTDNLASYHVRKSRILNGSHTCLALAGLLSGMRTVRDAIEHPVIGSYVKRIIYDDIIPVLPGGLLDLEKYSEGVIDRFRNPAFDHQLATINAGTFAKFKAGVLPTIVAQAEKNGFVHDRLVFAMATLIYFYNPLREGADDFETEVDVLPFMREAWDGGKNSDTNAVCGNILSNQKVWGVDMMKIPNVSSRMERYLSTISREGIVETLKGL